MGIVVWNGDGEVKGSGVVVAFLGGEGDVEVHDVVGVGKGDVHGRGDIKLADILLNADVTCLVEWGAGLATDARLLDLLGKTEHVWWVRVVRVVAAK